MHRVWGTSFLFDFGPNTEASDFPVLVGGLVGGLGDLSSLRSLGGLDPAAMAATSAAVAAAWAAARAVVLAMLVFVCTTTFCVMTKR